MTIPGEAIEAAALALHEKLCRAYRDRDHGAARHYQRAKVAVEAAAPLIAAAQREADAQLAEQHDAFYIRKDGKRYRPPVEELEMFADLLRDQP